MLDFAIQPGASYRRLVAGACDITNVYFDRLVPDGEATSVLSLVRLNADGSQSEPTVICKLIQGETEYKTLTYRLPTGMVEFQVTGTNSVRVLGEAASESDGQITEETSDVATIRRSTASIPSSLPKGKRETPEFSVHSEKKSHSEASLVSQHVKSDLSIDSRKHPRDESDSESEPDTRDGEGRAGPTTRSTGKLEASKRGQKKQKGGNGQALVKLKEKEKGKQPQTNLIGIPMMHVMSTESMMELVQGAVGPQVVYIDLGMGTGQPVESDSTVHVHYTASLSDGSIYAVSRERLTKVVIGSTTHVRGWQAGMLGMRVGGRRLIVVPPEYGYGIKAVKKIPASSTLVIDCALHSVA